MKSRGLLPLFIIMLLAVLQPSVLRSIQNYLRPDPSPRQSASAPHLPSPAHAGAAAATNSPLPLPSLQWAQHPTDASDHDLLFE